jgi:glycerol-3-phosphate acyltransferase PlsY
VIWDVAAVLAGYVLGSLPWGLWLPRALRGVDVRTIGSGNIGATNVWRAFGFRLGLAVMLLDVAKGAAAALVGLWAGGDVVGVLAGVAAMAGHYRPLFLGFARGGKIVATTGGVGLALAPLPFLCAAAVWILLFLAFRYASVSSIVGAVSLPFLAYLLGESWVIVGFCAAAALAIVVLHRANVRRLLNGTENRMELRRRRGVPPAGRPSVADGGAPRGP